MYYTPPSLSEYFLEIVSSTGINWKTARVLDPACGGGAFLLPVALKMREFLHDHSPVEQLESLGRVDEVPEPQAGGRDKNETDVAGCGFVVSGREPAALFEF